ncbi:hypothetical protein B0H15DRAFT_597049 [Mycena belliarum]|uniref:F-box domain-containing protein n=1 Tax=Mycena belliarum TaxID=1033014 RepID=A0AAD6TQV8_9AGAR|nr:hypothetical protein B0H15DRAFT_597049 [Mycena belliae]
MDLPAELAELIIDQCHHIPTVASCSLVCKAWHTRARFRLFSAPVTVVGVRDLEAFMATLQHPLCTIHAYIRLLAIRQSSAEPSSLNHVIPVLVRLSNLTHFELVAENVLLTAECRALFRSNFMSLRHLLLRMTFPTCADAVDLVCSFPLLESLHLQARWIGSSPPPALSLPVHLHSLDLDGFMDECIRWLLLCPPKGTISSLRLREVVEKELGVVFEYIRFVAATLEDLKLSMDARAESEPSTVPWNNFQLLLIAGFFLQHVNFDPIHFPELKTLEITGRNSNDVAMIAHFLSRIQASQIEQISFTSLVSVNPARLAWVHLSQLLSSHPYPRLRRITITTLPHLQPAIVHQLRRLPYVLDFVFPEGIR